MTMKYYMKEDGFSTDLNFGTLQVVTPLDEEYGLGYNPTQLLASSLAGCSSLTLNMVLKKRRKKYDDISVTAKVKTNPDERNKVEGVHVHFVIKSDDINEEQGKKLLDIVYKNCPMMRSVCDSIEITESVEIHPSVEA
ncbi:OsmC family protein [Oceanobacillus neutriphilus]|uniref:Osmotically inducible protein C n=1 Tax=Oceanobacillus neutriphilus TaxID=531815 RepID=A0ABQ2P1H5_9BACI|nr:OsmC family protein [Oceanobacillus neutriphilus]GGP15814.1 osmotically inducible protein C [Oceanobacillus neutriphilus]